LGIAGAQTFLSVEVRESWIIVTVSLRELTKAAWFTGQTDVIAITPAIGNIPSEEERIIISR